MQTFERFQWRSDRNYPYSVETSTEIRSIMMVPSKEWEPPPDGRILDLQLEQRALQQRERTAAVEQRQVEVDQLLTLHAARGARPRLGTLSLQVHMATIFTADVLLLMDAYAGVAQLPAMAPIRLQVATQFEWRLAHGGSWMVRRPDLDGVMVEVPSTLEIVCHMVEIGRAPRY